MTTLTQRNIEVDTHTHTVLSGHAFSTVTENCRAAAQIGLKGLCMTDHGPAMQGSMPRFAPCSYGSLPKEIEGVRLFPGVEFNILDSVGTIDITQPSALRNVRFGIGSMHDITIAQTNVKEHTQAYIAALHNPMIDILGHPGYAHFEHDSEAIVRTASQLGKLIEINNSSFTTRAGCRENCVQFAKLCMQYDVRICVSSDAHFHSMVGRVPIAMAMLEELQFPPELILNLSLQDFTAFVEARQKDKDASGVY